MGVMLPEFVDSEYFYDLGFGELLSEMDKQVLPDGADFESSTGYHRYALELFSIPSFCANKMTSRSKINIGPSSG
jgi:hypothetical protein